MENKEMEQQRAEAIEKYQKELETATGERRIALKRMLYALIYGASLPSSNDPKKEYIEDVVGNAMEKHYKSMLNKALDQPESEKGFLSHLLLVDGPPKSEKTDRNFLSQTAFLKSKLTVGTEFDRLVEDAMRSAFLEGVRVARRYPGLSSAELYEQYKKL